VRAYITGGVVALALLGAYSTRLAPLFGPVERRSVSTGDMLRFSSLLLLNTMLRMLAARISVVLLGAAMPISSSRSVWSGPCSSPAVIWYLRLWRRTWPIAWSRRTG
jgi:allophanate hydrolase subunit 2